MIRLAAALAILSLTVAAPARAHDVAPQMKVAAQSLLASLSADQKAKAVFAFDAAERRNWHYIPRTRQGLAFAAMTPAQKTLALALLRTGLSPSGYQKTQDIISLENVLRELEAARPNFERNPENYFVSLFGTPDGQVWGWRLEGHHLSLNFSLVGADVVVTPSFFGSNPGVVREGPRSGLRPLGPEEDLGRALVKSLTPAQQAGAIGKEAPLADIYNAPDRKDFSQPAGIAAGELTRAQKTGLQRLIRAYLDHYRPELADADWKKIERAGLDRIRFLWLGGLEVGQPHYYRVQGPTFVLEYDNTQNGANHAHSVWRDASGDFGDDLLKRHYETSHRP